MEINHPNQKPLTPEEQALLDEFRAKLRQRVLSVGLTSDDVRRIVDGMRAHPNASLEVIQAVLKEAGGPGSGQPAAALRRGVTLPPRRKVVLWIADGTAAI